VSERRFSGANVGVEARDAVEPRAKPSHLWRRYVAREDLLPRSAERLAGDRPEVDELEALRDVGGPIVGKYLCAEIERSHIPAKDDLPAHEPDVSDDERHVVHADSVLEDDPFDLGAARANAREEGEQRSRSNRSALSAS
jgi:hypothetical protein